MHLGRSVFVHTVPTRERGNEGFFPEGPLCPFFLEFKGLDTKTVRDIDPRMETTPEYLRQDVQDSQD
jgi:hypothetical protein